MAAKGLIVMVVVTNFCEAALLAKSSAYEFLQRAREKREPECFPGGCSTEITEAEEMTDSVGYDESGTFMYHGAAASKEINQKPEKPSTETLMDEGSGI